jgi:hypothetical protein
MICALHWRPVRTRPSRCAPALPRAGAMPARWGRIIAPDVVFLNIGAQSFSAVDHAHDVASVSRSPPPSSECAPSIAIRVTLLSAKTPRQSCSAVQEPVLVVKSVQDGVHHHAAGPVEAMPLALHLRVAMPARNGKAGC